MTKYQELKDLYTEKIREFAADPQEWMKFLKAAGKNYRLRFDEQVLTYIQKPEATALLPINDWNTKFHRWVNRGAKAIAVLYDPDVNKGIKYYFDVADTHEGRNSKPVPIWRVNTNQEGALQQALCQAYELDADDLTLADAVILSVVHVVEEKRQSFEERYQETIQRQEVGNIPITRAVDIIRTGSAYMVLSRLGIDPASYLDRSLFSDIKLFTNEQMFAIIGYEVSETAADVLIRAARTINKLNREDLEYGRDHIQTGRGLPVPERGNWEREGTREGGEGDTEPLRSGDPEILQGGGQGERIYADAERRDGSVHKGASGEISSDADKARGRHGKAGRRHGGNETEGSVRLGAGDEQHRGESQGDRDEPDVFRTVGTYLDAKAEGQADLPLFVDGLGEYLEPERTEEYQQEKEARDEVLKETDEDVQAADTEAFANQTMSQSTEAQKDQLEIRFEFTENAPLHDFLTNFDQKLSFALANVMLEYLDEKAHIEYEGGYDKTDFRIEAVINGEEFIYNGCFDIGDGAENGGGSLINHIFSFNDYVMKKDPYHDASSVEDAKCIVNILIPFLRQNIELTLHEQEIFERFKRDYPIEGKYIENKEEQEQTIKPKSDVIGEVPTTRVLSGEKSNVSAFPASDSIHYDGKVSHHETKALEGTVNYHHEDKIRQTFSKREQYRMNVQAIRVLLATSTEDRPATKEEQEVLAGYAGWGGIPEAFDPDKPEWKNEYNELKGLLTDGQYKAARASTLTSFYTPQSVIDAVYAALLQIGFRGGNILEPSCGVGAFMGRIPSEIAQKSHFYAVELDEISANIAHRLYPQETVIHSGFEKVEVPDNFFDAAVGNVPFGEFGVADPAYDENHFLIHDYFFAKALDKVRPGGVVIFITSKGTMDKTNSAVREYLARRADLLGAIRLPDNTFKANAGTEVTSDIIFLQKRESVNTQRPYWVETAAGTDGLRMNAYFFEHPEMILGRMQMVSGRYGMESRCEPIDGSDLSQMLMKAVSTIKGEIKEPEYEEAALDESETKAVPATPDVENFTFTEKEGQIYFREMSMMYPVDETEMNKARIRGLIRLRDTVRTLLSLQLVDTADPTIEEQIAEKRKMLNDLYEQFIKQFGLVSDKRNRDVFDRDSSYYLLKSLETLDDEGKLIGKADIFYKRTIMPAKAVTHVSSASDALTLSMAERGKVDLEYMIRLTDMDEEKIIRDLRGVIYLNPEDKHYKTADEYLSGNVRKKLRAAKAAAERDAQYSVNVEALKQVQPAQLNASEISVRLGATWIHPDIYNEFMRELLQMSLHAARNIKIRFAAVTGEWKIEGKGTDVGNVRAYNTYGTSKTSAYRLLEDALNLRETKIFDYIQDEEGRKKAVLNPKETAIAQAKQGLIKQAFVDWIWKDIDRREELCRVYNEKFNSIRPRQYDGSNLIFTGINPEIGLREHQKNAVARILYGGNTLLAHVVGAGKTYEMVAAAQESKRLGLCTKSLFVVPNHLIDQWAGDYLRLYPAANILVATKRDFEAKRRKQFLAKIATGNYDAIIMGHSQFEKIPLSLERQEIYLQKQIDELTDAVRSLKLSHKEQFSVKQMEKTKKTLQARLSKLHDTKRRDHVVAFEQLGIDRLFVDEAHYYKNLYVATKMNNVSGVSQTESQKAMDMYMKCQYMDEITDGKGVIFATGTPISNSMTEMYTMQRYLQHSLLQENGLEMFDAWASTFGETITAIELSPDGTGYRARTRFAKFYNLPELMSMFAECADIKTADVLDIPGIPEVEYHNVAVKATEFQRQMVQTFADRAEEIHNGTISPKEDNMLKITSDGRKLALDQRMLNPLLADDSGSKVNACVANVYRIWRDTREERSTQLIFCDLSTPKTDGTFSVYNDIRDKLAGMGVPRNEVQFIHNADTDEKKKKLFQKVRDGEVRILMGSTQKMGAGTNVQDRLIALHDLDCPWRPSDLQQRQGRIERQGNMHTKVHIYRYVTENTFDSYMWQTLETKQKFIAQIMTSKTPMRSCEDVDEVALSYAEIKALSTGDPKIKEKMDLDVQVSKLRMLKSSYMSERYALEDKVLNRFPKKIAAMQIRIEQMEEDIATLRKHPKAEDFAGMTIGGVFMTDKKEAGKVLLDILKAKTLQAEEIGSYRGFKLVATYDLLGEEYRLQLVGKAEHETFAGKDALGNIVRLDNILEAMPQKHEHLKEELAEVRRQMENAKEDLAKPFAYEDELNEKQSRLNALNIALDMDRRKKTGSQEDRKNPEMALETEQQEEIDVPHRRIKR